jgi:hypothetical protein
MGIPALGVIYYVKEVAEKLEIEIGEAHGISDETAQRGYQDLNLPVAAGDAWTKIKQELQ